MENLEFTVLKAYGPAIFNDDPSNLDEAETEALNRFLDDNAGLNGHWSYDSSDFEDTNFATDEVSGLKGDCFTLTWVNMAGAGA